MAPNMGSLGASFRRRSSRLSVAAAALAVATAPRRAAALNLRFDPLQPVAGSSFNLNWYTGKWYGMYADPISTATFQRGLVCVTAVYEPLPNGTLTVLNEGRQDAPDGPVTSITGVANCPPPGEPPACSVQLWGGMPFPAPYTIAALGPVAPARSGMVPGSDPQPPLQYQWAVVSNPTRTSLFILARDTQAFKEEGYEADALGWARDNGFVWPWNRPIPISQEGCSGEVTM